MGVPKFFRYMSERYPLISQVVESGRIPEFDNMYLDMNAIIHHCSHPNDDSPSSLPEHQIFLNIFAYIEHLFLKIKPKKLFFMAIDGVAPRAKMNQQRARRFRTARDSAKAITEAQRRGDLEQLTKGPVFDSNCITPGTEFMAKLSEQLKYFVNKKISEDSAWKGIDVVLSGHEVPGEGEHKIMEYIRLAKAQPDYNPNVRHCLYGLDADLIMLGLLSHDPHFCLLREEVFFGPQRNKKKELESQNFYLLHLSLFREYLHLDFASLASDPSLPFQYDLERVIDDFILLAIFVGNDFLPHLPGLHINEGAFNRLFDIYKRFLPTLGGYLNEHGTIHTGRLQTFIEELWHFEKEAFEREFADQNWFKGKQQKQIEAMEKARARNKMVLTKQQKNLFTKIRVFVSENMLTNPEAEYSLPAKYPARDRRFLHELADELKMKINFKEVNADGKERIVLRFDQEALELVRADASESIIDNETGEVMNGNQESDLEGGEWKDAVDRVLKKYDKAEVSKDFSDEDIEQEYEKKLAQRMEQWKTDYYRAKMEIDREKHPEDAERVAFKWIEGLQWVLHYYYDGVASWGWFYPYHYAPKITDFVNIDKYEFNFELGKPFHPFEQLMGVLPSLSNALVPPPYRDLMLNSESPVRDFYPLDFETDLNGKKQDWEAVIKIPFIDEHRLLKAMQSKESQLTQEEKQRNSYGESWLFRHDDTVDRYVSSPAPGFLPDISHAQTTIQPFNLPTLDGLHLVKGLCEGVLLGKDAIAGFPSLSTLPYSAQLGFHAVNVFQSESRNETMVLNLENSFEGLTAEEIAGTLVSKRVFVNWPFLQEAKVASISDELFHYQLDETGRIYSTPHSPEQVGTWRKTADRLEHVYSKRFGVILGSTEVIAHVCLLKGLKRLEEGALVKEFEDKQIEQPLQAVVQRVSSEDPRYMERAAMPVQEEFPEASKVFFLGAPAYGVPAQVIGHDGNNLAIRIAFFPSDRSETIIFRNCRQSHPREVYIPSPDVCRRLGISALTLAKITSNMMVINRDQKTNIGLGLKFEAKGQKVLGYTNRLGVGWQYSMKAVDLIRDYRDAFPQVIDLLESKRSDVTSASDIFPNGDSGAQVAKIKSWLKERGVHELPKVPLNAGQIEKEVIADLELLATELQSMKISANLKQAIIRGIPRRALLKPEHAATRLKNQIFSLGDRVIMVQDSGSVPICAKGLVIGIQADNLDVVFDIPFMAGTTLQGRCSEYRGSSVSPSSILNLSQPQFVIVTGHPPPPPHVRAGAARGGTRGHSPFPNTNSFVPPPPSLTARPAPTPRGTNGRGGARVPQGAPQRGRRFPSSPRGQPPFQAATRGGNFVPPPNFQGGRGGPQMNGVASAQPMSSSSFRGRPFRGRAGPGRGGIVRGALD